MIHGEPGTEAELAASLRRLWPHRSHESGAFRGLSCRLGRHRWARLDLRAVLAGRNDNAAFCRWRSAVRIGGVIYRG